MLDFNKYRNNISYPKAVTKSDIPLREDHENNESWGIALDNWELTYNTKCKEYATGVKLYNSKKLEIDEIFWSDLYKDLQWETLPKHILESLRNYAYENGHAFGFEGVYDIASGLGSVINAYEHELYLRGGE